MAQNKQQHYVPAFYLYNFTHPDQKAASQGLSKRETRIYYYDFRKGRIFERPIKKVAIESYLYSYKNTDGSYDHSLDAEIQKVESAASTAIEELSQIVKCISKSKAITVPIKDSLIDSIMELLFWQIKRHPDIISEMQSECEQWCLQKGYSPEKARKMALESVRRLGAHPECDIISELNRKNKTIIFTVTPKAHFITSDKPFVRFNRTGKNGISVEGTEMYFPITSSLLLFMCGNGPRKEMQPETSRPFLRQFNTYMARSAQNYLFGRSDRYLERLLRNLRNKSNDASIPAQHPNPAGHP